LIGDQMTAYMNDEFSSFGMTGTLPGGIRPFPGMDGGSHNEVFDQFSKFNRARGEATSKNMPGRRVNREGPNQRWSSQNPFGTRSR